MVPVKIFARLQSGRWSGQGKSRVTRHAAGGGARGSTHRDQRTVSCGPMVVPRRGVTGEKILLLTYWYWLRRMGAIKVLSWCYRQLNISPLLCWWLVLPRHGVGVSQIGNNLHRCCQVTLAALCIPSHWYWSLYRVLNEYLYISTYQR